jgi:hypothetical protein
MRLDEELRVALTREAENRNAPVPDVAGMISRGRVRRRRRTIARLGVAAAATVLVGSAAYGMTQADPSGSRTGPGPAGTSSPVPGLAATPPSMPNDDGVIEPGARYRVVVGADASGALIEADLTLDGAGWAAGDFPVLVGERSFAGFGVYQPFRLAAGTGCVEDRSSSDLGETAPDLAARLALLPRSTVLEPPAPTRAFGHDGLHLRLRVDAECAAWYRVADAARGSRGITYSAPGSSSPGVVIDFWVLDVGGTPVVVDQWRNADAPAGLVERATAARESITFVRRD